MKKNNLFLVLLMALVVMSCSQDETSMNTPQDNAIEFGTYVGRDAQTRATSIDLDGLKLSTNGFGVFAYYTAEKDWLTANPVGGPATSTPNFMYNEDVKWDIADAVWKYEPVKYWPNTTGERVSFFAYAPYNAPGATFSENTVKGAPTLIYTLGDLAAQRDLLWATPVKDKTKQGINENVKFTFNHALSRLGFKAVVLYDDINTPVDGTVDDEGHITRDENTTITVNSIKIGGAFIETNTLDLNLGTWGTGSSATKEYTLASTNLKENAVGITGKKTTESINNDESYLMFLPGETKGITVTVNYDVITIDSKLPDGKSTINNVITSESFGFTFVQGKAYNFVLHLGLTSVKLTATVGDWETEGSDISVNVPINQ